MDKQTAFDQIVRGLLKQMKRSTQKVRTGTRHGVPQFSDMCRYRGDGGCKCAAGFIIPDPLYSPDMEGHMFAYLYYPKDGAAEDWKLAETLQLDHSTVQLVEVLQSIHDNQPPEEWRRQLVLTAREHGLSAEVCVAR